jgi:hypothetical protein
MMTCWRAGLRRLLNIEYGKDDGVVADRAEVGAGSSPASLVLVAITSSTSRPVIRGGVTASIAKLRELATVMHSCSIIDMSNR